MEGITEYGYGYWSRYLYTESKTKLLGLSRLTMNQDEKDAEFPGDRVLVVHLADKSYHFSTYTRKNNQNNVNGDIKFPNDMEGEWVYIYFSYK